MDNIPEVFVTKIPISQLKKLRNDPQFALILKLGRYLNQLLFCQGAFLQWVDDRSPAGERQSHNALLFSCGVLYEALKIVPQLNKEFPSYKVVKTEFRPFNRNKELNFLKQNVLNKMRNGIVFHVDIEPIVETLAALNIRRLDLTATTGRKMGETHFQLSDEVAINYIIGRHETNEAELNYYFEIVDKILDVMSQFVALSSDLIDEYIQRKYWKIEMRK